MSAHCTIFITRIDPWTLVRLSGEIDISTAPRLEEALAMVDGPIRVDCSQLDFIDIAALRVLANAVETHGVVRLRHVSPFLRRVLSIAGWAKLFGVTDDQESAPEATGALGA